MKAMKKTGSTDHGSWTLSDIPYHCIDYAKVRHDENLFFVLAGASFIESGSDIYTGLLVQHFCDRPEVAAWLAEQWEPEELRHAQALRQYVHHAWPQFDWERARNAFLTEYSCLCSASELESNRDLELVARCVIETGTAALYRALNAYTDEPVLKQLTANIWSDEVRHYKHFYQYFKKSNQSRDNGRWKISVTLAKRLLAIRNEDADCALRHVFAGRYPRETCKSNHFVNVSSRARALITSHMTSEMMVKMFLKPLALPARLQRNIQQPLIKAMRRYLSA